MIQELEARGYAMVPCSAAEVVIEELKKRGAVLTRDAVVASSGRNGDLRAQHGDFWLHTDGVFCMRPPRWVVIHVLRSECGGALHVLDTRTIIGQLREWNKVWFGTDAAGVATAPVTDEGKTPIVRYRADYMRPLTEITELGTLHAFLRVHAARAAVALRELSEGDNLVLDNWRVLHRRTAFEGERVIRRLWLDDDG